MGDMHRRCSSASPSSFASPVQLVSSSTSSTFPCRSPVDATQPACPVELELCLPAGLWEDVEKHCQELDAASVTISGLTLSSSGGVEEAAISVRVNRSPSQSDSSAFSFEADPATLSLPLRPPRPTTTALKARRVAVHAFGAVAPMPVGRAAEGAMHTRQAGRLAPVFTAREDVSVPLAGKARVAG